MTDKTMDDKKKIFDELLAHLTTDDAPSVYMNQISKKDIFKEYPFSMLSRLKEVDQSPKHHPEGNVWNHTMLVIDVAARKKKKSRDPEAFMLAALLHDIGKAETTRSSKGRITAYNHEREGAKLAEEFLKEFIEDDTIIQHVVALVRWHMQILFVIKSMQFADIESMQKEIDIEEIALLGYCDRMGRLNSDRDAENENLELFLKKCHEFMTRKN